LLPIDVFEEKLDCIMPFGSALVKILLFELMVSSSQLLVTVPFLSDSEYLVSSLGILAGLTWITSLFSKS
jgi:hypothetical protein